MFERLRFARYALKFECAFRSDRWDAVKACFHPDATYTVAETGTRYDGVARGPDEIVRFFNSPEMRKKMTDMGAVIDIKTADEMRKIIPAEIAKWTRVARDAGIPRAE